MDRPNDQVLLISAFEAYRNATRQDRYPLFAGSANLWRFVIELAIRFPVPNSSAAVDTRSPTQGLDPSKTVQDKLEETLAEAFPDSPAFVFHLMERLAACLRQATAWDEGVLQRVVSLSFANYLPTDIAADVDESAVFVEMALSIIKERWTPHPELEIQGVT
jgi:hypothetical protein